MVIQQLRCAGVIEAIRIARAAYPNRLTYAEFLSRFYLFIPRSHATASAQGQCEALMQHLHFQSPVQYQCGRSRIYFQVSILEGLESRRSTFLDARARLVQRIMRGSVARQRYRRKLHAITKLQSVGRCVVCMHRYHTMHRGFTRLQALGRGVLGRRLARAQRQRLAAVLLQALVRGHVCRLDYVKKRHLVIRVQAFVRMKIQQRKHMKATLDRAMEADMTYQLQVLQERLEKEKQRSAELLEDQRHSMSLVNKPHRGVSNAIMVDAGGMLEKLKSDNEKYRAENGDLRIQTSKLKEELERYKSDKETKNAAQYVKMRQVEAEIKVKDSQYQTLQRENEKLQKQARKYRELESKQNSSNSSIGISRPNGLFRKLGSKKDVMSSTNSSYIGDLEDDDDDDLAGNNSFVPNFSQKSAETAKFLKASAQRMSKANVSGAMSSLKGKMAAVKDKYGGDFATNEDVVMTEVAHVTESFNLDSMPEAPLPPGWEARVSRSKGKVYYCNPSLKLTQWDRPTIESIKARRSQESLKQ